MESILSNSFEPTVDPAAAFDEEGALIWMNAALRRLLGYAPEEDLSPAILADFYPESEYEPILWEAYSQSSDRGAWCGLVVMRTKDDRLLETHHRIERLLTSSGEVAGLTIRVGTAGELR